MRPFLFFIPLLAVAADYDVLVRHARVVDGSGNASFIADVAVKYGRIVAVKQLPGATETRIVEAGGRVVAPGFIDVHTHVEGNIEQNPRAHTFLLDGVTKVVPGDGSGSELN